MLPAADDAGRPGYAAYIIDRCFALCLFPVLLHLVLDTQHRRGFAPTRPHFEFHRSMPIQPLHTGGMGLAGYFFAIEFPIRQCQKEPCEAVAVLVQSVRFFERLQDALLNDARGKFEDLATVHEHLVHLVTVGRKYARKLRADRSQAEVDRRLHALRTAAKGEENLMPFIYDAVKSYATLGEICDALRDIFGTYEEVAIT